MRDFFSRVVRLAASQPHKMMGGRTAAFTGLRPGQLVTTMCSGA